MDKSALGLTINIRNKKKGMTTTEVRDVDGTFVVKLRGLNIGKVFLIHNYLSMKMKIILMKN